MRYFHGYLIQKCSEASLCLNDGENFSRCRRCSRQYTAGYERPAVSCPSGRNRCPSGLMAPLEFQQREEQSNYTR